MSVWIRCMVCCTYNTRSCKHIFSQRRAQSSPTRMPVNKHSKIPVFLSEKFDRRYRHKTACSLCVNTRISVCSCRTVTACKSQETEISNLTAKCSILLRRKTAAVTVPAERPLFLMPPETRSSVQNDSMCWFFSWETGIFPSAGSIYHVHMFRYFRYVDSLTCGFVW